MEEENTVADILRLQINCQYPAPNITHILDPPMDYDCSLESLFEEEELPVYHIMSIHFPSSLMVPSPATYSDFDIDTRRGKSGAITMALITKAMSSAGIGISRDKLDGTEGLLPPRDTYHCKIGDRIVEKVSVYVELLVCNDSYDEDSKEMFRMNNRAGFRLWLLVHDKTFDPDEAISKQIEANARKAGLDMKMRMTPLYGSEASRLCTTHHQEKAKEYKTWVNGVNTIARKHNIDLKKRKAEFVKAYDSKDLDMTVTTLQDYYHHVICLHRDERGILDFNQRVLLRNTTNIKMTHSTKEMVGYKTWATMKNDLTKTFYDLDNVCQAQRDINNYYLEENGDSIFKFQNLDLVFKYPMQTLHYDQFSETPLPWKYSQFDEKYKPFAKRYQDTVDAKQKERDKKILELQNRAFAERNDDGDYEMMDESTAKDIRWLDNFSKYKKKRCQNFSRNSRNASAYYKNFEARPLNDNLVVSDEQRKDGSNRVVYIPDDLKDGEKHTIENRLKKIRQVRCVLSEKEELELRTTMYEEGMERLLSLFSPSKQVTDVVKSSAALLRKYEQEERFIAQAQICPTPDFDVYCSLELRRFIALEAFVNAGAFHRILRGMLFAGFRAAHCFNIEKFYGYSGDIEHVRNLGEQGTGKSWAIEILTHWLVSGTVIMVSSSSTTAFCVPKSQDDTIVAIDENLGMCSTSNARNADDYAKAQQRKQSQSPPFKITRLVMTLPDGKGKNSITGRFTYMILTSTHQACITNVNTYNSSNENSEASREVLNVIANSNGRVGKSVTDLFLQFDLNNENRNASYDEFWIKCRMEHALHVFVAKGIGQGALPFVNIDLIKLHLTRVLNYLGTFFPAIKNDTRITAQIISRAIVSTVHYGIECAFSSVLSPFSRVDRQEQRTVNQPFKMEDIQHVAPYLFLPEAGAISIIVEYILNYMIPSKAYGIALILANMYGGYRTCQQVQTTEAKKLKKTNERIKRQNKKTGDRQSLEFTRFRPDYKHVCESACRHVCLHEEDCRTCWHDCTDECYEMCTHSCNSSCNIHCRIKCAHVCKNYKDEDGQRLENDPNWITIIYDEHRLLESLKTQANIQYYVAKAMIERLKKLRIRPLRSYKTRERQKAVQKDKAVQKENEKRYRKVDGQYLTTNQEFPRSQQIVQRAPEPLIIFSDKEQHGKKRFYRVKEDPALFRQPGITAQSPPTFMINRDYLEQFSEESIIEWITDAVQYKGMRERTILVCRPHRDAPDLPYLLDEIKLKPNNRPIHIKNKDVTIALRKYYDHTDETSAMTDFRLEDGGNAEDIFCERWLKQYVFFESPEKRKLFYPVNAQRVVKMEQKYYFEYSQPVYPNQLIYKSGEKRDILDEEERCAVDFISGIPNSSRLNHAPEPFEPKQIEPPIKKTRQFSSPQSNKKKIISSDFDEETFDDITF